MRLSLHKVNPELEKVKQIAKKYGLAKGVQCNEESISISFLEDLIVL